MAKQKLKRFAEFATMPNTFDFAHQLKGKWNTEVFKNNNPIVLELGCGKGEYTLALAHLYPNKNFIGIDIKSNRMWVGAKKALEQNQMNIAFLRIVLHKIHEFFEAGEVSEIWITFPDPFVRIRSAKHRLTHPRFLQLYKQILHPEGLINFKTDSDELFSFTQIMLSKIGIEPILVETDVHGNPNAEPLLKNVRTYYENLFSAKGKKIKFMKFSLLNLSTDHITKFEEWFEAERKKLVALGHSTGI
ncbi:MAG: tRNA (guanosine(46)-N7)-methyltransferase TrmB [Bacteroidia bacterium]|nr:tRNA (guanosine(46)-N7)-methyltransferase TrmB [Bacteroidia bacterium]